MPTLSGNSRTYGIVGDPVGHSISPAMFNAAFDYLNLDSDYVPFCVKKADLRQALEGIKALNIAGVNITIPHKVAAVSCMDMLNSQASEIGAINTVLNSNGKLTGYNTDSDGFLKIFENKGISIKNKKVVVLGAGGASRAIIYALVKSGADLTILNRTTEKSLALADNYLMPGGGKIKALKLTESNLASEIAKADLFVNTTSVGMNKDESIIDTKMLRPSLVVCDIVYTPRKTRLLRDAEAIGAVIIEGVEMLIGQAVLSFELWTGKKAPVEVMKKAALRCFR